MSGHTLIRDDTTGEIATSDSIRVYDVPDPSGVADGYWLRTSGGAAVWVANAISGGSAGTPDTQIQLRADTAANWTSDDPTLALGEVGLESDTGKIKFGDGATAWVSLPYFGATAGVDSIDGLAGPVTLVAGANVTITDDDPVAGSITIAATGGGGGGGFAAYAKRTTGSPLTTTSTTFAGGVDLLASDLAFTADGTSDYLVTVSAPTILNSAAGAEAQLNLVLDGSDEGRFWFSITGASGGGSQGPGLVGRGVIVAPSAGAHTVNIRLWSGGGGTSEVAFGAGGAGADAPIAVTIEAVS